MLITTLAMTTTTFNRIKIKFIFTTIVMMQIIYLKQTRPPDTNIPLFFHILPVARWYKRLKHTVENALNIVFSLIVFLLY